MSKIKEYHLNGLNEFELAEKLYNEDLIDSEYKDLYVTSITERIMTLKLGKGDHKLEIQKLQQKLDEVTND